MAFKETFTYDRLRKVAKTAYARAIVPYHVLKGLAVKRFCYRSGVPVLPDVPEASAQTYPIGNPPAKNRKSAEIPRIIWSYWNSPVFPRFVRHCMANWAKHNPNFAIRVLNDENLPEYLPDFPRETPHLIPAKRADWIRMELLARHGGIWLDASTVLTRSLDWAIEEQRQSGADFVGYWIDGMTADSACPVVENWFLAAPPGSPFLADWCREFVDHALHDVDGYIKQLRSREDVAQIFQNIDAVEYLSCHVAAQVVLRGGGRYVLRLLRAQDDAFVFHERARWNRSELWKQVAFRQVSGPLPRLVKFRGRDRKHADEFLAAKVYVEGSIIGRELGKFPLTPKGGTMPESHRFPT